MAKARKFGRTGAVDAVHILGRARHAVSNMNAYRCSDCGTLFLLPKRHCPQCGRVGKEEVQLSGRGRIRTWTIIHVAPTGFQAEAPYTVALVELEEGVRVMGRIEAGQVAVRDAAVLLSSIDPERGPVFGLA